MISMISNISIIAVISMVSIVIGKGVLSGPQMIVNVLPCRIFANQVFTFPIHLFI